MKGRLDKLQENIVQRQVLFQCDIMLVICKGFTHPTKYSTH